MNNEDTVENSMEYMRGFDIALIKKTLENAEYTLTKGGKVPFKDLVEIYKLLNRLSNLITKKTNESLLGKN